MRTELITKIKNLILSKIGVSFNQDFDDVFFEEYVYEEDDDPEVIFEQNGITITVAWEYGTVFIDGLTPEEQHLICE